MTDQGLKVTSYYTEKIKTPSSIIKEAKDLEIGGTPLEYSVEIQGVTMTFVAQSFKKDFDTAVFTPTTDGYKEMTQEELSQMFGGMGGNMGF